MRRNSFARRSTTSQAGEVMGIAAADVFANLFLLALVVIGLKVAELTLSAGQAAEPATTPTNVFVTPTVIRMGDAEPVAIDELPSRLKALAEGSAIRIYVEPTVAIEREHAILAAAMAAGVGNVNLVISTREAQ
jgi:hypothetical protein